MRKIGRMLANKNARKKTTTILSTNKAGMEVVKMYFYRKERLVTASKLPECLE